MTTPRILCVSFSPIHQDSRVLRQLTVLKDFGEVTTVGYGEAPCDASFHIRIPDTASSLPQTVGGVARLALRRHRAVELKAPGEQAVLAEATASGPYNLVVANDARALPLAFAAAQGAPVYVDMHEWAMSENSSNLAWRLLVGPYMDALCRRYLPQAAAVTTVGQEISRLYATRYGIAQPTLVRNAGPFQELTPASLQPGAIRLVHAGMAVPKRNIESLIDATLLLDERFTLDLYLVPVDTDSYINSLKSRARGSTRIRFHDPVATVDLPRALNQYDIGVYLLPIKSLNHRLMLPNKFFDFIQARLGVIFGPSVETDRLITRFGVGEVARGWEAKDLVAVLEHLSDEDIARFKSAAHVAAFDLSSDSDVKVQHDVLSTILRRH